MVRGGVGVGRGGVEVAVGFDGVEAVEGGVEGWVFEEFVLWLNLSARVSVPVSLSWD